MSASRLQLSQLSLVPSPVCGVDGITYINRCVAVCQGGEQTLHLKDSSTADSEGQAGEDASITNAPTVNLNKADLSASVNLEVLTRYASSGFKFATKVLLKSSLGNLDPKVAKGTADGPSVLASNRTLLAARVDADGHLYLKSSPASELAAAFQDIDSQATLPLRASEGSPKGASQLAQQPKRGSRKLLLTTPPESSQGSGRGLLVTGPDGRVEVDTTAYPYSAVGLIIAGIGNGSEASYCSGTLVGPRSVLTAGHCVYDAMAREFYDISMMTFIPNQHGGRTPGQDQRMAVQSVMTYFNNAGQPFKCDAGDECHHLVDWELDFAVITLKELAGENYGYLSVGYTCGEQSYEEVDTAGYPGDLPGFPWRMYGDSGALGTFDACLTDLSDSVVTSTLDSYPGQSGSGVWDSEDVIRALVNASGSEGEAYHRTIAKWVFQAITEEIAAASS
ncbi:hypothetical protein N2152v2_000605 [Parachlorella kessleri]